VRNKAIIALSVTLMLLVVASAVIWSKIGSNKRNLETREGDQAGDTGSDGADSASAMANIFYGPAHAYMVSTPKGWALDDENAKILGGNGCEAVLYPESGSFRGSPVNMYLKLSSAADSLKTVDDFARYDSIAFTARRPSVTIRDGDSLITLDGNKAKVRHYFDKDRESFEAIAWVVGHERCWMFVFYARDESLFKQNYPSFEELVKSYMFLTDKVRIEN
jgi:hypothetical protein